MNSPQIVAVPGRSLGTGPLDEVDDVVAARAADA